MGRSNEIRNAEKIAEQFECNNIEHQDLNPSNINRYHERALSISKEKVKSYIMSYKSGDILFSFPLEQVIQQQYTIYKSACESLGGVSQH